MALKSMVLVEPLKLNNEFYQAGDVLRISDEALKALPMEARTCLAKADDLAVKEVVIGKAALVLSEAEELVAVRENMLAVAQSAKVGALEQLDKELEHAEAMLAQANDLLAEAKTKLAQAEAPFKKPRRVSGGTK